MADIKREQERDELHRAIWGIADELRGSVDGWDFKSYVLGIMFYRYISFQIRLTQSSGRAKITPFLSTTPVLLLQVYLRPRARLTLLLLCIHFHGLQQTV